MRDIEIRPTIMVWDLEFRRWLQISAGSALLGLLGVIQKETARSRAKATETGLCPGSRAEAERERFGALIEQIGSEMADSSGQLTDRTSAAAIAFIGRHRIVRQRKQC